MTKLRIPDTIPDAMLTVLAALGAAEAGRMIGKTERYARAFSDPDDGRELTFSYGLAFDVACAVSGSGTPLLDTYRRQVEEAIAQAGGVPAHRPGCPHERLENMIERLGALAAEMRESRRPDSEGGSERAPSESRRIFDAARHVREILDLLIKDMAAEMAAARPRAAALHRSKFP